MIKVVTLRCPECGNTYSFNVGADSKFATWHDVAASLNDKKEYGKLLEAYSKIIDSKSKAEMNDFSQNRAESLYNIRYDLCGEESVKLLDVENDEQVAAYFNDGAKNSIVASSEKWEAVAKKEGVIAFQAMYLCPKTHNVKQGIHLSMHWLDGNKAKTYTYRNNCGDCGNAMTLLDDGNVGFMHEDCPTVARCEKCKANLVVDKVSFRIPLADTPQ